MALKRGFSQKLMHPFNGLPVSDEYEMGLKPNFVSYEVQNHLEGIFLSYFKGLDKGDLKEIKKLTTPMFFEKNQEFLRQLSKTNLRLYFELNENSNKKVFLDGFHAWKLLYGLSFNQEQNGKASDFFNLWVFTSNKDNFLSRKFFLKKNFSNLRDIWKPVVYSEVIFNTSFSASVVSENYKLNLSGGSLFKAGFVCHMGSRTQVQDKDWRLCDLNNWIGSKESFLFKAESPSA